MTLSRIPAARAPLTDERTGSISREWYRYFFAVYEKIRVGEEFLLGVAEVTGGTYSPDNKVNFVTCTGNCTIILPSSADRSSVLSVTNAGVGTTVSILPVTGETIRGDTGALELSFRWSSVQLCPVNGGYIVV